MPIKVKICGITNWADAKLALDEGADALGLNFYPLSPRYVSHEEGRALRRRIPVETELAGVFVNATVEEMDEIALELNLFTLQLHGEEPPECAKALGDFYVVVKAFRVGPKFRVEQLKPYRPHADYLLDGFRAEARGGTGTPFDWSLAREARKHLKKKHQLYIAGGLTAENVQQALREAKPDWVDVCSGIETRPGKKDKRKLRKFMEAVRRMNRPEQ